MTAPRNYGNLYFRVKYFLMAYRALADGKMGILHLDEQLQSTEFPLSEWKVIWIGTCALLRTSVEMLRIDAKSCINQKICEEITVEWKEIRENKGKNTIFWEFLRKERNNILHEYKWDAYEAWMQQDKTMLPTGASLISVRPQDVHAVLIMRSGRYKNRNSLELLKESADWVESRIFGAIRRAGFEPEEERNVESFEKRPIVEEAFGAKGTMLDK